MNARKVKGGERAEAPCGDGGGRGRVAHPKAGDNEKNTLIGGI